MEISTRIKEILAKEAQSIASIQVTDAYEKAVYALKNCKGKIITTGMGKAGYIAKKFAATLCSTATTAAYLHPGEAAHGDLGLVNAQDWIVAFSTSGKTREVIQMLELSKKLGIAGVIGITSHPDSELRRLSDLVLDMGVIHEPCRMGLVPTASIVVMLAISDALALTLADLKEITPEDFGKRHHGGYLGSKVRDFR